MAAAAVHPETKKVSPYHNQLAEHLGTSYGVYSLANLANKTLQLAAALAPSDETAERIKGVAGPFGALAKGLALPRAVALACTVPGDVAQAYEDPSNKRGVLSAIKNSFELAAVTLYSTLLFWPAERTAQVANVCSLGHDAADLTGLASDYQKTVAIEKLNLSSEMREANQATQKLHLMKIVKAVISVALGVLGLAALIFGGPLLPAVILLTLSVAGAALSVTSHFYKENLPHRSSLDYYERLMSAHG